MMAGGGTSARDHRWYEGPGEAPQPLTLNHPASNPRLQQRPGFLFSDWPHIGRSNTAPGNRQSWFVHGCAAAQRLVLVNSSSRRCVDRTLGDAYRVWNGYAWVPAC
jgi:hypothetical protein